MRRTTSTLMAAGLIAVPTTVIGAAPASAAEREFRYAGAEVEFEVPGRDVFKIRVQKVGTSKAATRTITLR